MDARAGAAVAHPTARSGWRPTAAVGVEDLGPLGLLGVVAPRGVLDVEALEDLTATLDALPVWASVVDLTDCVLTSRAVLAELAGTRAGRSGGTVLVVCRRLSGRRLLGRFGVGLPVFGTVEGAVEALVRSDADLAADSA